MISNLLLTLLLSRPNFNHQSPSVADQLIAEIKGGKAMEDLGYLSDDIGPRLTGSENCLKAEDWALKKMKEYGAENAHLEAYDFASRWERGHDDYLCMLTQGKRQMEVHAMAWNPATRGMVTADAALVTGTIDQLTKDFDQYKGKIVVLGRIQPGKGQSEEEADNQLKAFYKGLAKEATAILVTLEHQNGIFTMYGSPYDWYLDQYFDGWPRIPIGFLNSSDRGMLVRLLSKGEAVKLQLRLGGKITKTHVQEHVVVGEIPGTEKPDEVVVVGGHLDSWDLGTGTTDNGTGAIATLETLRAMHKLNLKPKRTIRFILFTGEEQGSIGATAYVAAHKSELSNIQAVVIDDVGAGKPDGFTVQGYSQWIPTLKEAMAPAASLGATKVLISQHWDSDQDSFVNEGVPGFFMDQDITDYFASTHHSQVDMMDHVKPDEYISSVQAFAVTAWGFANIDARVPHVAPGRLVGPDKDPS